MRNIDSLTDDQINQLWGLACGAINEAKVRFIARLRNVDFISPETDSDDGMFVAFVFIQALKACADDGDAFLNRPPKYDKAQIQAAKKAVDQTAELLELPRRKFDLP